MRHPAAFLVLLASILAAGATTSAFAQGCDAVQLLDFDDRVAPSGFDQAVPLSSEYSGVGITFLGPAPGQGGALLDEASGMAVTGHSSPNFLAFDTTTYATGPETLELFSTANHLGFSAAIRGGIGDAGTLTLDCFDAEGNLLGSNSVAGSPTLQSLSVDTHFIASCRFSFTSRTAIVDDLTFTPCPGPGTGPYELAVPLLDLPRLVFFAGLLAGAALLSLKRRS